LNPRPGCFMQLRDWYDDIWGEIVEVYPGAVSICVPSHTEYAFFHNLRPKICDIPPPDARIVHARVNGSIRTYRRDVSGCINRAIRDDLVEDVLDS